MFKPIIRSIFESLGYRVQRISPPQLAEPDSVPCEPLRPVCVELFPGLSVELELSDSAQRLLLIDAAHYEAPCPQLLGSFSGTPGSVFFDLGANWGYYSYWMLAHCPNATVYSFEPNPAHVRRQRDVAASQAKGRYFPQQLGLGDAGGKLELTISSLNTGWSTFGSNPHFKGLESSLSKVEVPVVRFDAWRAAQGIALPAEPSWVVKMDVEGFEPRALRGMREALQARAFKALLIEVLDHTLNFCGASAADVFDLMNDAGYAPFDIWLKPTRRQPQESRNVLFLPKA